MLVPQVDRDGNDTGGIALPTVAVPLGTFTGWNYQVPSLANLDYLAGLSGSFIPFAKTADDRKTIGDPRLSIAERYPERDDYLGKVRSVVQGFVKRRLIRAEDLDRDRGAKPVAMGLSHSEVGRILLISLPLQSRSDRAGKSNNVDR